MHLCRMFSITNKNYFQFPNILPEWPEIVTLPKRSNYFKNYHLETRKRSINKNQKIAIKTLRIQKKTIKLVIVLLMNDG